MDTLFCTSPDGTRIAYDMTSSGPALILLHGAGKTRREWHQVGYVKRLKEDFTVITVDIRGNGESDRPLGIADYAIETICDDINAVADACDIPRYAIWGFSFGGNIARYLGAWSDRLTAIAVIGVPFGPAVSPAFDQRIDEFMKKWEPLVQAYHAGTLSEDIPRKERKPITSGLVPVMLACLQAMRDWPSVEPGEVHCPAMLLAGTKNKETMEWIEANQQALDRANVHTEIINGLTHNQEFSQINRVFPVVSSFLKSQISA